MPKNKEVSLTNEEKRVVKALLAKGWRNQDIQALINSSRKATINSGRITGVKKNANQSAASDEELALFELRKRSYDPQTGLNRFDDERLVRAREAMLLAVHVFNSGSLKFKTEVFTMLANVAWTYLLHEFYHQKGVALVQADGRSLLLSQMIDKPDCPLSNDVKRNLRAMKILRDKVEHLILGHADLKWSPIFQACCLNFDKALCALFGDKLTLANDLSLALQFAKPSIEQLALTGQYAVPPHIAAIDAQITEGMTPEQLNNIEFQFKVVYTLDAASKSQAHFVFVSPDSATGKEIHNVLAKKVAADELYPFKPLRVVELVAKGSEKTFTNNDHTKAWKHFKVRPRKKAKQPGNTLKDFCIYHAAHGDYTYSQAWVDKLIAAANDRATMEAIRKVKM